MTDLSGSQEQEQEHSRDREGTTIKQRPQDHGCTQEETKTVVESRGEMGC